MRTIGGTDGFQGKWDEQLALSCEGDYVEIFHIT